MSRQEKGKISTDGGAGLGQNPFGAALGGLDNLANLPVAPTVASGAEVPKGVGANAGGGMKNRGRVDVLRSTAGRGGKTVTVAKNFIGIGAAEKEALCKKMRAAAGCGGTVKDGAIEIQGDQREVVMRVLAEAGFRPVAAGG
jgi:translation initiation factor 1